MRLVMLFMVLVLAIGCNNGHNIAATIDLDGGMDAMVMPDADMDSAIGLDSGTDADVDASVMDAGTDSGTVTSDSGTDSGTDAGMDSGPTPVCGNGIVETGEGCDDGNTVTESCSYGVTSCTVCTSTCQYGPGIVTGYCGDGVVQTQDGEVCDDHNMVGGDGCEANCLSITTWGYFQSITLAGNTCPNGTPYDGINPVASEIATTFASYCQMGTLHYQSNGQFKCVSSNVYVNGAMYLSCIALGAKPSTSGWVYLP